MTVFEATSLRAFPDDGTTTDLVTGDGRLGTKTEFSVSSRQTAVQPLSVPMSITNPQCLPSGARLHFTQHTQKVFTCELSQCLVSPPTLRQFFNEHGILYGCQLRW